MVLSIPSVFSCCWYCSTQSIKEKIDTILTEQLPNETAWQLAQIAMLFPILRRMASLDARMPMRWVDSPLPECPPGVANEGHRTFRMIRCRFWELCRMAKLDFKTYQSTFNKPCDISFFHAFESLAKSILDLIIPRSDVYQGLYNQVKLISNDDVIFRMVTITASMSTRSENHHSRLEVYLPIQCIENLISNNHKTALRRHHGPQRWA